MIAFEGLDRNFQFLVLEVRRQLDTTRRLLKAPSAALIRKVSARDNYTDTLKSLIEKKCVSFLRHSPEMDKTSANAVAAINVATINLERIADFCVNVAAHVEKLTDKQFITRFDFEPYFAELRTVMPLVVDALSQAEAAIGLRICRSEQALDELYDADFKRIRDALRTGRDTDDLLCCLYIVHYLERMGDSLLNIGEAVLFAATGEKLKLHEFQQLRDALVAQDADASVEEYDIDFRWETRSGCRIARVEEKSRSNGEPDAIFKKGEVSKIRVERDNILRWQALLPGLVPTILEYRELEGDAALLLTFLDGFTLRDLALSGKRDALSTALSTLGRTLETAWTRSRAPQSAHARFLGQIQSRLDDVFQLHPDFAGDHFEVGDLELASLEELIQAGRELDDSLSAPFQVLVHGDFNADNVIYHEPSDRIHFIDLYRSGMTDYVQDVSVFLVSNFRVPVIDAVIRDLLNFAATRMFEFARTFAAQNDDKTFEARLALGLARSFITSTRFEMDRAFAKRMFQRGMYLLRTIVNASPGTLDSFRISPEVLVG